MLELTRPWETRGGKISDAYLRSIMTDHEFTSQLVDRLRVVISASVTVLPEDQKRRLIGELLTTLIDRLYPHFATEEEGGFLADVVERRPDWAPRVKHLLDEHQTMIEQFRGLRAQCNRMDLYALEHAVAQAIDQYVHHETEENRLIQRIYYDIAEAAD